MLDFDLSPWFEDFRLFAHVPADGRPDEVLVAVHGISRNAVEHLRAFRKHASARMAVIAPRFPEGDFPDYQRLGLYGSKARADLTLDTALERFSAGTGIATGRFHLFGFSGGAQFAHRYAMLNPHRIRSLHVASAGWYTLPDPDLGWPYGLGRRRLVRPMIRNLPLFRRLPIHVYVGSNDTGRDPALRQNRHVDRLQGRTRVDRARTWAAAVGARTVNEIEGADHDFLACCAPPAGAGLVDSVLSNLRAGFAHAIATSWQ